MKNCTKFRFRYLLLPYPFDDLTGAEHSEIIGFNQAIVVKTAWRYQPLHGLDFLWLLDDSDDYRWIRPKSEKERMYPPPEWMLG